MTAFVVLTRPLWEHGATALHAFTLYDDAFAYVMAYMGDNPGSWHRPDDQSRWFDAKNQMVIEIQICPVKPL